MFQDSVILVSGVLDELSCYYYGLFAYNEGYYDLICVDSDYIYTAGYNYNMDDVGGDEQIVISKYDKSGNQIFSISYPDWNMYYFSSHLFQDKPLSMDIAADGTILLGFTGSFIKCHINGAPMREYPSTIASKIKGVKSITASRYVIYTENRIYLSDSIFRPIDSANFMRSIHKLLIFRDTIYTLCDSSVVRLDTNLFVIDTFYRANEPIHNIEIYDNHIWLQIRDNNQVRVVMLKDADTRHSLVFPLLADDVRLIVTGNRYIFAGNSFSGQIGLYQFEIEDSTLPGFLLPDIELINFDLDSITYQYWEVSSFPISVSPSTQL